MAGSLSPQRPRAPESGLRELLEYNVTQLGGREEGARRPGDSKDERGLNQKKAVLHGLPRTLAHQNRPGSSLTNR